VIFTQIASFTGPSQLKEKPPAALISTDGVAA